MKTINDNNIQQQVQQWEASGSNADFDAPKVWANIENRQNKRVFVPWYYSAVAVVVFLFLLSGFLTIWTENQDLRQEIACLPKTQTCLKRQPIKSVSPKVEKTDLTPQKPAEEKTKVVVKKEIQIQTVFKESPELLAKYEALQKELTQAKKQNQDYQNQLAEVGENLAALQDSVEVFKMLEAEWLLAENTANNCNKATALSDIKITINDENLSDLPMTKSGKKKKKKILKMLFRFQNSEKTTDTEPLVLNALSIFKNK